ncbi:sensor histidine kinase [Frigidibacter sp. MR17.24]|uniref:sensor histidine kinase n=1 Tax=Frigidibacter sp. MR17.24 TaxID=3127345 RepID=UPI003012C698
MTRIIACIAIQHDVSLVVLAAFLCIAGSWVTARLYAQARTATGRQVVPLYLMTATTAGVAIWCTHFVAMLGFSPNVPVSFDLPLTFVSLLIAVFGSAAGIAIAARSRRRRAPALAGAVLGLSISGMHYAGMIAYRVDGLVSWDRGYLVVSILLAVSLSALALTLGSRPGRGREAQMTAALTAAIVLLHFTGMAAFEVVPLAIPAEDVNPEAFRILGLAISIVALLIVLGALLGNYVEGKARRIADLTAARNAAESASRAKSEFMSVLSHELRTPLTIVLGYAAILSNIKKTQVAGSDARAADKAELYGTKIGTAAQHLLGLINEILDYSRLELGDGKLDRASFSVRGLLTQVEDQFQGLARDRGMRLEIESDDIIAFADRGRCLQILINLMGNAVKFSRSPVLLLRARAEPAGFRLEVEDRGCGIPADSLDRIFEAFQQLETPDNRSESGTGLGLAICRKLAAAHGGTITVRSKIGQGTCFTVTFPATALDRRSAAGPRDLSPPGLKLAV